jgi:hypothetical protein
MTFKNITQLLDHFKDEDTCRAYLEHKRWGGVPACHHCGSINVYRTLRGFRCREKLCDKKFSVISGSIYENTKLPLRIWFACIYLITTSKKGVSSLQIARQLNITQKSAWFLNHRIRQMLTEKAPSVLRGVVAVDETYVGGLISNKHLKERIKLKGDTGRSEASKTPVLALVENDGKVVVKVLPFVSKKNVSKIIHDTVEKGSIMVTDSFAIYTHLSQTDIYKHIVVDHSKNQYVKDGYHTNRAEGFFSLLKRGILGIFHYVSPQHLQRYCNEFASKYNTIKVADDERFHLTVENADGQRLKYKDLINHDTK